MKDHQLYGYHSAHLLSIMRLYHPTLSEVKWSKGKYDSYYLQQDGFFFGTVHPPGYAYEVNYTPDPIPNNNLVFISSRNQQQSRGAFFICASLPRPYKRIKPSTKEFECDLILLLGAKSVSTSLFHPKILLYYYSLRKGLSPTAITDAFNNHTDPSDFIRCIFDTTTLKYKPHKSMHIRYLNQIHGRTLSLWNIEHNTAPVDGKLYYQCSRGPDKWLNSYSILHDSRSVVQLTKAYVDQWPKHPEHYSSVLTNDVASLTGTKRISQFSGGKVLVIYTTIQKSFGKYMWMPLPGSSHYSQEFALITIEQKIEVDEYFRDPTTSHMRSSDFRKWMMTLTKENGFVSFVSLTNLQYGASYFEERCNMFVVSVVSDSELDSLSHNTAFQQMKDIQHQYFTLFDRNVQDPFFLGNVVFRGYPFPTVCHLDIEEYSLIMEAYNKSFHRGRSVNQGVFHMLGKRQSSMSNLSMGVTGDRWEHDHYNETTTTTSLKPMSSTILNSVLNSTGHAQEASGQISIGLIKKAISHYNNTSSNRKDIIAEDICPYGILTCPRNMNGALEPFCNEGHRDTTDCIDREQGEIVNTYLNHINNPIINDYLERMDRTFGIEKTRVKLPTTCGWKLMEQPEAYGYKHLSFFVVSEAGISWDLSSHSYNERSDILAATFFGSLVEHLTSCSIWMEESSGDVTTICPGTACNIAWGKSGGSKNLKQFTLDLMNTSNI